MRVPKQATDTVILLSEPCQECSRPIEVTSPEWYRITWDYTRALATWDYRPVGNAFCVACQVQRSDPAHASALVTKLESLQARKTAIGLPDAVTMYHHRTLNKHVYGVVNGVFNFDEYFCHVRGAIPDTWTIPHRLIVPNDGTEPLTLLYSSSDVYLQGVDARVALTWDVARPTSEARLQIDGWSRLSPADLSRLMEGVRVFMERPPLGRPRGTTDHTLSDYILMFRDVTATLGRSPRSLDEFVSRASLSPDTVKRNMKRWGTTWGGFKRAQSVP